ncbi:MAG: sel1 repeat family protein [Elusimicrobia bacterium]|nr:sel1 repeat family protein [Elusimicrobiota bacterium]
MTIRKITRLVVQSFILFAIALNCAAAESVAEAKSALKRRDFVRAVTLFREAALQGNAEAQYFMGTFLENGSKGVPRDSAQAIEWYKKAAKQGYSPAQFWLALDYYSGSSVPKDYDQGLAWLKKAGNQGNADAQMELGHVFEDGTGVAKDYVEAARWYRKAAEQGDWGGTYVLGQIYEKGQGVTRDLTEAYKWYALAVAVGHSGAREYLKSLDLNLPPTVIEEAMRRASKYAERLKLDLSVVTETKCPEDEAVALGYVESSMDNDTIQGFEVVLISTAEDSSGYVAGVAFASLYGYSLWLIKNQKYKDALPILRKLRWATRRLATPSIQAADRGQEATQPDAKCLPVIEDEWLNRWGWVRHKMAFVLHRINPAKNPEDLADDAVEKEVEEDMRMFGDY